jgi:hypothetical protein
MNMSRKLFTPWGKEIESVQPIEVVALFEKGKMKPIRFRLGGKVFKIQQINGSWENRVGKYKKIHFAVVDSASNLFEISYDEREMNWSLERIETL